MQRRAAAVYGVIFLVFALGSYGMIVAASAPTVSIDDPDFRQANDSEFTAGGLSYAVTIDSESETATLQWTNQNADYIESWSNGDQVVFQESDYEVAIPDEPDPSTVQLTEVRTLPEDSETTTVNDTEYVVVERDDGTRELVPTGEYLDQTQGEAETRELVEGQTYTNMGNETMVESIDNESVTLTWTAPRAESENLAEGDTIEIDGQLYVAHFPTSDELVLTRDVSDYEDQLAVIDNYHQRINGLWGVSILSSLLVVVMLGASYLPSRY